jgi:hypothetical protein
MTQDYHPWTPMSDPVDLKHLLKLQEELNECGAAVARCLIQGIDEREPVTHKSNRTWLEEEISDVIANVELVFERFSLAPMNQRIAEKKSRLRKWHNMELIK